MTVFMAIPRARIRSVPLMGLVLAALSFSVQSQNQIHGIDVETRGDQTRVVIKLSGKTNYTAFTLHNPERYVLDIKSATLSGDIGTFRPQGVVEHIRTATRSGQQLRVVMDLNNTASVVHGRRSSGADNGSEIIVELTGKPVQTQLLTTGATSVIPMMHKAVQRTASVSSVTQINSRAWSQCKTRRLARYLQSPVVMPAKEPRSSAQPKNRGVPAGYKEAHNALSHH